MLKFKAWKGWSSIKTWFKKIKNLLLRHFNDKNFLLGLGVGLIIASLLMNFNIKSKISKVEVEKKAHEMGMMYPEEIKAYFQNDRK